MTATPKPSPPATNGRASDSIPGEARDKQPNNGEGDEHADVTFLDIEIRDATLLAELIHDAPCGCVLIC